MSSMNSDTPTKGAAEQSSPQSSPDAVGPSPSGASRAAAAVTERRSLSAIVESLWADDAQQVESESTLTSQVQSSGSDEDEGEEQKEPRAAGRQSQLPEIDDESGDQGDPKLVKIVSVRSLLRKVKLAQIRNHPLNISAVDTQSSEVSPSLRPVSPSAVPGGRSPQQLQLRARANSVASLGPPSGPNRATPPPLLLSELANNAVNNGSFSVAAEAAFGGDADAISRVNFRRSVSAGLSPQPQDELEVKLLTEDELQRIPSAERGAVVKLTVKVNRIHIRLRRMNDRLGEEAGRLEQASIRIEKYRDEAMNDLAASPRAIEAARKGLADISKDAWREVRSYTQPPLIVRRVLEAVLLVCGTPSKDWDAIKSIIRRDDFVKMLQDVQLETMNPEHRARLESEYLADPKFTYEAARRASRAAPPLLQWVTAQMQHIGTLLSVQERIKEAKEEETRLNDRFRTFEKMARDAERQEHELRTVLDEYNHLVDAIDAEHDIRRTRRLSLPRASFRESPDANQALAASPPTASLQPSTPTRRSSTLPRVTSLSADRFKEQPTNLSEAETSPRRPTVTRDNQTQTNTEESSTATTATDGDAALAALRSEHERALAALAAERLVGRASVSHNDDVTTVAQVRPPSIDCGINAVVEVADCASQCALHVDDNRVETLLAERGELSHEIIRLETLVRQLTHEAKQNVAACGDPADVRSLVENARTAEEFRAAVPVVTDPSTPCSVEMRSVQQPGELERLTARVRQQQEVIQRLTRPSPGKLLPFTIRWASYKFLFPYEFCSPEGGDQHR